MEGAGIHEVSGVEARAYAEYNDAERAQYARSYSQGEHVNPVFFREAEEMAVCETTLELLR